MDKPNLTITPDQARDLLVNLTQGFALCRALLDHESAHQAHVDFMQENLDLRNLLMDGLGI